MKTIQYTTVDKSSWGAGPWQSEPDKMQFADPDTGLPCLIVRNPQGALCGYVGVPEGHRYFGVKGYSFDVSVHGGITFTASCNPHATEEHGICHLPGEGKTDKVWWLGFDCAHAMDLAPGMNAQLKACGAFFGSEGDTYRDIEYVKEQIANLAQQLKAEP